MCNSILRSSSSNLIIDHNREDSRSFAVHAMAVSLQRSNNVTRRSNIFNHIFKFKMVTYKMQCNETCLWSVLHTKQVTSDTNEASNTILCNTLQHETWPSSM